MQNSEPTLIFYSTLDCQLCEAVEERLKSEAIEFRYVDISEDDRLIEKYGWFIPVLEWKGAVYKSPLDLDTIIPMIKTD